MITPLPYPVGPRDFWCLIRLSPTVISTSRRSCVPDLSRLPATILRSLSRSAFRIALLSHASCFRKLICSLLLGNLQILALILICLRFRYFDAPSFTYRTALAIYLIYLTMVRLHSKLFIGGLNWDTTDGIMSLRIVLCSANCYSFVSYPAFSRAEGLRDYFSQFGKVW